MEWKKVIYHETPNEVRCIQGITKDVGEFIEVNGSHKQVLVNKANIISIASKRGENNGPHVTSK